MKKVLFSVAVMALALTSCTTHEATSTTMKIPTSLTSDNVADLDVSDQLVTYTYTPDKAARRLGVRNVKRIAVSKALESAGGGDILVSPQYEVVKRNGLFFSKVKSVTVKGHPATYKRSRSINK
ncbi:MAG: hypothetical protein IJY00_00195 [Bacteroidaceae bacterium]|nr:hypothetical protein [Bacteroidaceae bacterium]